MKVYLFRKFCQAKSDINNGDYLFLPIEALNLTGDLT